MVKTQIAKLNNLNITPRKVRLIANTLRGLSTQEAEAQLLLRVQRSSKPLLKLLRSAIANAKNQKLNHEKLFVSEIFVGPGPVLKRFLPRAMGRATPLLKRTSHVTIVLKESEKPSSLRFTIIPPAKKEKKEKTKKIKQKTAKETGQEMFKKQEKPGFLKRLFRRKSI
ncbi:MAG: 50S ribosomal protein L22 [Patescibacteria group bacterium]